MFVIRATAKLRKHWKIPLPKESSLTSGALLGDFYAHVVATGRRRIILGVFERTYLPLVLPLAQQTPTLLALQTAVKNMLRAWDISSSMTAAALLDMDVAIVTVTASRVALGVLNDFSRLLLSIDSKLDAQSQAVVLGEAPLSPLKMESPKRATQALLGKPRLYVVR